jgi:putative copper export protein/methionine-rich copper-binding protein CopC/mono/diheme cytochrome c family protein
VIARMPEARAWLITALMAAFVGGLLSSPGSASAHALLVRVDPQINAALPSSPRIMNLFFSEPLQEDFSSIRVLDSAGQRVDFGDVAFNPDDNTNMTTRVQRLSAGVYTVVWNTLSQIDGHTWNGSYSFTVLNQDGSSPGGAAFRPNLSSPGPGAAPDAAVKWFSFVGVIGLVSGPLFVRLAAAPAAKSVGDGAKSFAGVAVRHGWDLATGAVLVLFATTTYDAISGALKLGGLEFIDEFLFETRAGLWLELRWTLLIMAALILVAVQRRPQQRRSSAALGAMLVIGAGLIASLSGISHGAALDRGGIWGTLFDALHVGAAAVWVGMLTLMVWTFWSIRGQGDRGERRRFQIETVRRFSWIAAATVPILATAGGLSLLIQVPAWRGFSETDWGAAMLVKLAVLAMLFAVAGANALLLRPRIAIQDSSDVHVELDAGRLEQRFSRLMRLEVALMLVVLAATASMTQLSSPRSTLPLSQDQKDNTIEELLLIDDLTTTLTISPNLVGRNRYEVELRDAGGGQPLDPVREVRLHFRFQDPAVGPVIVPLEAVDDSLTSFLLEGAFFGLAGSWDVDVEVRREVGDDAINGITTDVEQPFLAVLPFGQAAPGALALPITQFDWNGVGALWAAVLAGLLIAYRATLRGRVSKVAGDAALAGGTLGMAVAIVLTTGVHVDPGRTVSNPVERNETSVANGTDLFAQNCRQCHGDAGLGDGPLAGSLPTPPANFRIHVPFHADGVLFTWITDGIRGTGMPAWKSTLSDRERWDLVNFLRTNFAEPLRSEETLRFEESVGFEEP